MILSPPTKDAYVFTDDVQVDVKNRGFAFDEIAEVSEAAEVPEGQDRGKGAVTDWLKEVFGPGRVPKIEELKSQFGYRTQPKLIDLLATAEAQGTPLEGDIQARSKNYNFFVMECGVYILPQGDEKFKALKFEIDFKDDRASTYKMVPGPETKKVLELGGKANIGFGGNGEIGIPKIAVPVGGPISASLDAAAKAELDAKFIFTISYELKSQVVDAFGAGNPFCRWLMYKGENLRNDVAFYPVIMTPKSVTSFPCEFRAYFKIDHPDWPNAEFFLKPPLGRDVAV